MTTRLLIFAALAVTASLCATGHPTRDLLQRVSSAAAQRQNPFAGSEQDRPADAKLFQQECASCHGREATGVGKEQGNRSRLGSSSPFPADFNVDPVFRLYSPRLAPISDVLIKPSEPIAYSNKSFSIDHLVLADFAFRN
jgi:hypothetical protein